MLFLCRKLSEIVFNLSSNMHIFDAVYKGNTHKMLKKPMDGHFSDVQKLLKKWSKIIFLCGPLLKPFWIYHITRWPTYAHA